MVPQLVSLIRHPNKKNYRLMSRNKNNALEFVMSRKMNNIYHATKIIENAYRC